MPRLRWLKRIIQSAFAALWAVGFRIRGHLTHQRPTVWSSPGGERILVVAPHPDDEVIGCAGTLLEHHRRGDRVRVCCVTDGGQSRALGLAPSEMAVARRGEIDAATRELGAELEWLGLPEGEWCLDVAVGRLTDSLERFNPHIVYAPSRVDFHPEHQRVAHALAEALRTVREATKLTAEFRIYPSQVPLTSVLTNLIVPVSLDDPRLLASLHAYRSQLGSIERGWRHRRYLGARYGFSGAEEFWCMAAKHYERLHRRSPNQRASQIFRGVRYYAWSDPLAYLRGRSERRRLKAVLEEG